MVCVCVVFVVTGVAIISVLAPWRLRWPRGCVELQKQRSLLLETYKSVAVRLLLLFSCLALQWQFGFEFGFLLSRILFNRGFFNFQIEFYIFGYFLF